MSISGHVNIAGTFAFFMLYGHVLCFATVLNLFETLFSFFFICSYFCFLIHAGAYIWYDHGGCCMILKLFLLTVFKLIRFEK